MKKCTLFAIVGCALMTLQRIWWLVVDVVGSRKMAENVNMDAILIASCVIGLVGVLSLLVFFATLYSRQK